MWTSVTGATVAVVPLLIVFIVFACLLMGLAIICWTIIRLISGGTRARDANADEARLIQELHHGLSKMEQRIDALETLLLERERGGRPS